MSALPSVSGPWGEIAEILTLRAGFNAAVVVCGSTLLGLSAGVVGVFAMLRKRSLLADAVSHATLPGIAAAYLLAGALGADPRSMAVLLLGAGVAAAVGAWVIQLIVDHSRLREDAAIGIVLSVFFGIGIVLLSYIQQEAPEGSAGLKGFIFGQAATMRRDDVILAGAIACVALLVIAAAHKELAVVCFNDAFASVDGWPVRAIDLAIIALVVLVTVAGIQAVGLLMIVALLIIPAAAARFWTNRLARLTALSGLIGAASGYAGSAISAAAPDRPAGAVIVLCAGAIFTISMIAAPKRGVAASAVRRVRTRARIASDHLLEAAHEAASETLDSAVLDAIAHDRGWSRRFVGCLTRVLAARGFFTREPGGAFVLTPAGRARGARVSRNHALWEQYLIVAADVAPSHVDWSVDQVEHLLSEEMISRLEARLREAAAVGGGAPDRGIAPTEKGAGT